MIDRMMRRVALLFLLAALPAAGTAQEPASEGRPVAEDVPVAPGLYASLYVSR